MTGVALVSSVERCEPGDSVTAGRLERIADEGDGLDTAMEVPLIVEDQRPCHQCRERASLCLEMMMPRIVPLVLLVLAAPSAALAQPRLSLDDAVARARSAHPTARAAAVGEREATWEISAARANYFPRVDVLESWQRSNLPVFAFSSLLSQRRFSERDFDVARLNNPDPLDNFRSAVSIEQTIFDGALRPTIRAAQLGREAATLRRRQVSQDLATATAETYGRIVLLDALARAAQAAVAAASEDARRARDREEAGTVTRADVLSLDVHVAAMREREIQAAAEARVSRARLNELMGAPLDAVFMLELLPSAGLPDTALAQLEKQALEARPDTGLAQIAEQSAGAAVARARGAFLPQVALRSAWEWNGGTFDTRASGWLIGAEVRLNLFRGFADRARLEQARLARERQEADRVRIENAARLDVRAALARLEAAEARRNVAQAIVSQARESQRITRDRYEQGLADLATLLKTAQAVLDADAQEIGARVDVMVYRAALDRALGR
jgi:outer membrane protein